MGGVLVECLDSDDSDGVSCAVQHSVPSRFMMLITGLDSLAQKLANMSLQHIQASYYHWHYCSCIYICLRSFHNLCRLRPCRVVQCW